MRNKVVVYPAPKKEKSEGGIFLPDDAKKAEIVGKVIEVGPDVPKKKGVKPGDTVVFAQYAGTEIVLEDEKGEEHKVLIMDWEQIGATIETTS